MTFIIPVSSKAFSNAASYSQTIISNIQPHSSLRKLDAFSSTTFTDSCTMAPSTTMLAATVAYLVGANTLYLARRSHLTQLTMKELWKIRTIREEGVSKSLYVTILLAWQSLVVLFPLAEMVSGFVFRHVCFFYSYPKAGGCGVIFEPRNVQHLSQSKRAKHQIRLDWHRFSLNVGNVGREGYRHPPSVFVNVPHVDIPKKGLKHRPWRRKEPYYGDHNNGKVNKADLPWLTKIVLRRE